MAHVNLSSGTCRKAKSRASLRLVQSSPVSCDWPMETNPSLTNSSSIIKWLSKHELFRFIMFRVTFGLSTHLTALLFRFAT